MENWRQYLTKEIFSSRQMSKFKERSDELIKSRRKCKYYWIFRYGHELLDNDYKDRDDLDYLSMVTHHMKLTSDDHNQDWSPQICDPQIIDGARDFVENGGFPVEAFHKLVKATNQHIVAPQQAKELFKTSEPPSGWCQIIKNLPILFRESNPVNEYRNFPLVFNHTTGKLSGSDSHKKYLSCLKEAIEKKGYSVGDKEFSKLISEMKPIRGFDYSHPDKSYWRTTII